MCSHVAGACSEKTGTRGWDDGMGSYERKRRLESLARRFWALIFFFVFSSLFFLFISCYFCDSRLVPKSRPVASPRPSPVVSSPRFSLGCGAGSRCFSRFSGFQVSTSPLPPGFIRSIANCQLRDITLRVPHCLLAWSAMDTSATLPLTSISFPKQLKRTQRSSTIRHTWGFREHWRSQHYHTGDLYQDELQEYWSDVWKAENPGPYHQFVRDISAEWPHLQGLADFMDVGTEPLRWRDFHGAEKAKKDEDRYTYPDDQGKRSTSPSPPLPGVHTDADTCKRESAEEESPENKRRADRLLHRRHMQIGRRLH